MVFPVVLYWCESWTIKKAECWRIDVFGLWCWRRLLRVPWTAKRSNQSILKEINPEYSLERPILKLKLWYFGRLIRRAHWLEKTLKLGKIKGMRSRGWQRMRWLAGITDSTDMNLGKVQEILRDREAWCAVVHGGTKSWTKLGDWTTTTIIRFRAHPDMVKNLLAKQETQVWSLGWSLGEGNGNPLQYSCLENSIAIRDWWATVPGVTKSQTQLSN